MKWREIQLLGSRTAQPTVRQVEFDRCTTHGEPIGEVTHINGELVDTRWLNRPFLWHLDASGWPTVYCAEVIP